MNPYSLDALGSIFADTLAEILFTTSGLPFSVISSEPDSDFSGIAGLINMLDKNGQDSAAILISANEADMRVLCASLLGVSKDAVTKEDMDDALCEFVNMTAGNVKLRLGNSENTFTLSTPFAVRGENMSLATKKRVNVISRRLGNGEISLKLKVIQTLFSNSLL